MAQIVTIAKGTERTGVAEIGDIVAIHEDNVKLTGSGYAAFEIIKIEGQTATELRSKWVVPEISRLSDVKDKVSPEDDKDVWKDASGAWCEIVKQPKYSMTAKEFTVLDKTKLDSKLTISTERDTIINKVQEKIHLNVDNNVPVTDILMEK